MKVRRTALAVWLAAVSIIPITARASAQVASGPAFSVSIGSVHHLSDIHQHYPARFRAPPVFGAGASMHLRPELATRLVIEYARTSLKGRQVPSNFNEGRYDHQLAAEIQLFGLANGAGKLSPYAGAGGGVRWFRVNSVLLVDDAAYLPWSKDQRQPAVSALAGVRLSVSPKLTMAGEVRWSRVRFRAGEDSWGLTGDPVQWHNELRPTIRLDVLIPR